MNFSNQEMSQAYDDNYYQRLVDKISHMNTQEHNYIFTLVQNDTNKYTRNRNGVFVNMSVLTKETIEKMASFVQFCEQQREFSCKSIS